MKTFLEYINMPSNKVGGLIQVIYRQIDEWISDELIERGLDKHFIKISDKLAEKIISDVYYEMLKVPELMEILHLQRTQGITDKQEVYDIEDSVAEWLDNYNKIRFPGLLQLCSGDTQFELIKEEPECRKFIPFFNDFITNGKEKQKEILEFDPTLISKIKNLDPELVKQYKSSKLGSDAGFF